MKKAQIYKISNTKTVDIYIGSTVQTLKLRFKAHRSNAKLNKNGKLYDCIRENGIECFKIELLEEFNYQHTKELGDILTEILRIKTLLSSDDTENFEKAKLYMCLDDIVVNIIRDEFKIGDI